MFHHTTNPHAHSPPHSILLHHHSPSLSPTLLTTLFTHPTHPPYSTHLPHLTAHPLPRFWHDFINNGWGNFDVMSLLPPHHQRALEPLRISRTSFWCAVMYYQAI